MAYKLSLDAHLPASAREALVGQVRDAVDRLQRAGGLEPESPEAVVALHDARKNLKKARSLLRLLRSSLPKAEYRREMEMLRDCARALADARDSDALLETVRDLRELYAGDVPAAAFTRLERSLRKRARTVRGDQGGGLEPTAERLEAGLVRLEGIPTDKLSRERLLRALQLSYAAGRAAARRSSREPSVENLHEWRKRVKDLWYQERLTQAAWLELLEFRIAQAHSLSDLLGDDHDLAMLLELLHEEDRLRPLADRESLIAVVEGRRMELQSRAALLGARLYAERPKAYGRRMAVLVRTVGHDGAPVRGGHRPVPAAPSLATNPAPEPDDPAPEPDNSAPEPDNSAPEPDNSAPEPDNSVPEPANSAPEPDNSAPEPDPAA
jgi:CHAD domain-containing protein